MTLSSPDTLANQTHPPLASLCSLSRSPGIVKKRERERGGEMRGRLVTAAAGAGGRWRGGEVTAWWWAAVVLGYLVSCARAGLLETNPGLAYNFYQKSCPNVDSIVRSVTWAQVAANPALPGRLLRLHFHDCFVKGCDASILLDNAQSEKTAGPNLSVGGYEVIDAIKTQLEQSCPGVVSCADIVALAARDAVSYQFGATLWQVETGRRDGNVSLASNTGALPSPFAGFNGLLQSFSNRGLNLTDLVALSGAHTIGVAGCSSVTPRLYQGNATNVDPLLDSAYAKTLMSSCPNPSPSAATVNLDSGTPLKFDSNYYTNLQNKQGTLASDAALTQNAAAAQMVADFTNPIKFYAAFSISMKKMGRVEVLTGTNGQIRKQCRQVGS
ncbi:peroxidase A2-like [Phragmites australis]|uniref:peroxidase A2-like n=1 Tax=Phragmites australis TaxID=29695 RepID=UPI002D7A380D|nr:peroxidase A2-like [Phragmites australis]